MKVIRITYSALKQLTDDERRRLVGSLLPKGDEQNMKAKKGMTKNQKLKLNKTASAKKKVKATKK